jgi:hypothetical protein
MPRDRESMPTSLPAQRRNPCLPLRGRWIASLSFNCIRDIFSCQLQLPKRCRCLGSKPSRLVWQPAHTRAPKRIAARERAALFTDLPQMRVEDGWGSLAEYQSMRVSVLSTAAAMRAGVLCCVLFMVISAQALAQTSATDNPGPATAQPLVAAEEKPAVAAEEKPPVADDKPATAEQKPAPAEEKPAIAQEKPAAAEEKSAATDDKPAIVEQKPAPAEEKPVVAQDKPAAVEAKPATAIDKPAIVDQTSTVPDAKPAVVEQKPAPAVEKPAVVHAKPAAKQKSVARPSKSAARSKAAAPSKPVQTAKPVQPARASHKPRERTLVMLCTRFRTYNASSGTYRGYDGQMRSCR